MDFTTGKESTELTNRRLNEADVNNRVLFVKTSVMSESTSHAAIIYDSHLEPFHAKICEVHPS